MLGSFNFAHVPCSPSLKGGQASPDSSPSSFSNVFRPLRTARRSASLARLSARSRGCRVNSGAFFCKNSSTGADAVIRVTRRSVSRTRRSAKPRFSKRSIIPETVLCARLTRSESPSSPFPPKKPKQQFVALPILVIRKRVNYLKMA
jgi:hypothetical protein